MGLLRLYTSAITVLLVVGGGLAGLATLRLAHARLEAAVYRDRLEALSGDYEQLRERYASLVKETAVTELLVEDGKLAVAIRTAEGELVRIDTPYDPTEEIYVDYVVRSGRLWIRRVFDAATPPQKGTIVDASLAELDWANDAELAHGKATYRALGDGRWIVTATGNGALGLARATDDGPTELAPPPVLREYPPAPDEASDALRDLGAVEIARAAVAWLRGDEPAAIAPPL